MTEQVKPWSSIGSWRIALNSCVHLLIFSFHYVPRWSYPSLEAVFLANQSLFKSLTNLVWFGFIVVGSSDFAVQIEICLAKTTIPYAAKVFNQSNWEIPETALSHFDWPCQEFVSQVTQIIWAFALLTPDLWTMIPFRSCWLSIPQRAACSNCS